jgi:hypothetical protein
MKFDVIRDLTNKVFTTDIVRKIVPGDPDDLVEAGLENDFGPVQVEIGGLFEGFIVKAADGSFSVALTGTVGADTIVFKMGSPSNTTPLSATSKIEFKSDAKLESPITFDASTEIPALKVAELKCELFEKVIRDRIEKAVDAWKKEATVFEATNPADTFSVPLS